VASFSAIARGAFVQKAVTLAWAGDDCIRGQKSLQALKGLYRIPGGSRHQARQGCADPERVPSPFVLVAENLRWNGEVKSDHIRQCQGDDSVHMAHCSHSGTR
jgi:hypothetical protein